MGEKPNFGTAILGALIVGGILGVLGEALVVAWSFTPLYGMGFSTVAVLASIGVIGVILFDLGLWDKIEKIGGMGSVLPFCGLAAALAGTTFGTAMATGSKAKGAAKTFVEMIVKIVLFGTAINIVIAVIVFLTGFGAANYAPYAPGGVMVENVGPPNGTAAGPPMGVPVAVDPMAFVWAFVFAGVISAVLQLILMLTKIPMPAYLVTLFSLGGVLAPFGVMKAAVATSGGGFQVQVFDAGEAIVSTFSAFLSGNFTPFISVLCLFAFLYAVGVLGGFIRLAIAGGKKEGAAE
jgi:hypothetical protein